MVLVHSEWTSNGSFVVVEIENLGVKKGGINAFSPLGSHVSHVLKRPSLGG